MSNLHGLFSRKPRQGYPQAIAVIKSHVRDLLELPLEIGISVSEIACCEPDCPDIETVNAVLEPDRQRLYRVHKPLSEVSVEELKRAPPDERGGRCCGDPVSRASRLKPLR